MPLHYTVLTDVDCTQVPLLQSYRVGYEDVWLPGRSELKVDLVWFDPVNEVQVIAKIARRGSKRTVTSTAGYGRWKMVHPSFGTASAPLSSAPAAGTVPEVGVSSDRGNSGNANDRCLPLKRSPSSR